MTAAAADLHARTGHTAGNGALMRTSPVALAHLDDPAAVVEAATVISALTHTDELSGQACALWSLAIRHAVLEGEFDIRSGLGHLSTSARGVWSERIDEAETRDPTAFTPNGYVVTALRRACTSRRRWTRSSGSATTSTPSRRSPVGCSARSVVRRLSRPPGAGWSTATRASAPSASSSSRSSR